MSMTIEEAGALFATKAKVKALECLADDKNIRKAALVGLKGSAAAVLLGRLAASGRKMLVVADDADAAGYLFHDISRMAPGREIGFFRPATVATSNTAVSTPLSRSCAPRLSTAGSPAESHVSSPAPTRSPSVCPRAKT